MTTGFTTTHKLNQTLALLRQLPGNGPGASLLLGPLGAGKSTLAAQLCRKPPAHWRLARVTGSPDLSTSALVRRLAADWLPGIAQINIALLLARLAELQREGLLPVVVVDDAHRLPPETLRFLLQTRPGEAPAFHAILLADSDYQSELGQLAALGSEGLLTLYLSPWTREEVAACYRLNKGQPPSPRQLDRLLELSDGLPGPLMELLDDPSALNPSRFNLVLVAILALTLIGGLLLNSYLAQDQSPAPGPTPAPAPELTPSLDPPPTTEPAAPQAPTPEATMTPTVPITPITPSAPSVSPPEHQPATEPATAVTEEPRYHDSDWLLQQPVDRYCLELTRFAALDEIAPYIRKHRLADSDALAWYRSGQDEQRPFALVIGSYPDHRAALRARLLLPDTIDPEQVEPRGFSKLQRLLRKQ